MSLNRLIWTVIVGTRTTNQCDSHIPCHTHRVIGWVQASGSLAYPPIESKLYLAICFERHCSNSILTSKSSIFHYTQIWGDHIVVSISTTTSTNDKKSLPPLAFQVRLQGWLKLPYEGFDLWKLQNPWSPGAPIFGAEELFQPYFLPLKVGEIYRLGWKRPFLLVEISGLYNFQGVPATETMKNMLPLKKVEHWKLSAGAIWSMYPILSTYMIGWYW